MPHEAISDVQPQADSPSGVFRTDERDTVGKATDEVPFNLTRQVVGEHDFISSDKVAEEVATHNDLNSALAAGIKLRENLTSRANIKRRGAPFIDGRKNKVAALAARVDAAMAKEDEKTLTTDQLTTTNMGEILREIPQSEKEIKTPDAANEKMDLESGVHMVNQLEAAARAIDAAKADAVALNAAKEAVDAIGKMGLKELSKTDVEAGGDETAKLEAEVTDLEGQLSVLPPKSFMGRFNGNNRKIEHLQTLIEEKTNLITENKALAGMNDADRAKRQRGNNMRAIR